MILCLNTGGVGEVFGVCVILKIVLFKDCDQGAF